MCPLDIFLTQVLGDLFEAQVDACGKAFKRTLTNELLSTMRHQARHEI